MLYVYKRIKQGKCVSVDAMTAYRGSKGEAPLVFNLGTRWK